ncbi:MAG TPA: hypothetical protein VGG20_11820 [Thermoanaerobaculia bacterium]
MRRSVRLLALACFSWGLIALTAPGLARETGAPVELVAPRDGATLAAGSVAELAWAPGVGFSQLPGVEEWEAFLSLDGGASFPVRITPHLDQDLRRVRFQVPPFATADARILLRFGDERRETVVELPARLAIAAAPLPATAFLLSRQAFAPGEPARPGSAGVVAWVEGSRRGGVLRQVVAAEPFGLRSRLEPPKTHAEAAVLSSSPSPPQPSGSVQGDGAAAPLSDRRRGSLRRAGTGPDLASDILLLIQRQNE